MFFTLFGNELWVGGGPKGLVHNLLMRFFTLGSQKSKFSKLIFLIP